MNCDNCGNDIEVEFEETVGRFHCRPCRWAWETPGQRGFYNQRRLYVLGERPLDEEE